MLAVGMLLLGSSGEGGIAGAVATGTQTVTHYIALMLENRSFDHMLGLLKAEDPTIEGCLPGMGRECQNPLNPQQASNSSWYGVGDQPQENCTGGPSQSYEATLNQVYGTPQRDTWANLTALGLPNMTGFIAEYSQAQRIMDCWPPQRLPALTTLAREFASFNRYYTSVPGQTEPNRVFFFSATSRGWVNDDDDKVAAGWTQRTIFQNIAESKYNRTWSVYFTDQPSALFMEYPRFHLDRLHPFDQFYADAAAGNLANFVFLEPRYNNYDDLGLPSQDQEAPHNVGQGDRLIKQVYEAVRASPLWNQTMLIICYDEHGGFFDHVPPPSSGIPSPDGIPSHDSTPPGFNFDRLGVRLPFVLVSPWIQKGLRPGEPDNGSHYEHASMSATLLNTLIPDMKPLTKRDAWAAPFDWVLNTMDSPRTDCPTTLPLAPITDP